jgi:hypothetical protein
VRVAVVLPTAGRGALAIESLRSLQGQGDFVEVFVSDNSAAADETLRDFCARSSVHYLRPRKEMTMPRHWDWALREVLSQSRATHLTVHYDRKVSKPEHFRMAESVVTRWPGELLTWTHDYISDIPPPLRLWQVPWTGKVYALRSERLLQLTGAGHAGSISSQALPLLSNCLVPREILSEVLDRYGSICDSTSADSAFAYRFFTIRERYLHLDRSLGVLHRPDLSTGAGYLRGGGREFADFRKRWGDRPWLDAAPIPGLDLGMNMLYHEYELVRRATGSALPAIDRASYLRDLSRSLPLIADREARATLRQALASEGWSGGSAGSRVRAYVRHRVLPFLDDRLGLRFPGVQGRIFRSDRAALEHALTHPLPRDGKATHLALLDPVDLGPA